MEARAAAALEASNQREHDQIERRYEDRREAYLAFERAVSGPERRAQEREFAGEVSPFDRDADPWEIAEVLDALVAVQVLASDQASEAAEDVSDSLHAYVYSWEGKRYKALLEAKKRFRAAVRKDIGIMERPAGASGRQSKPQVGVATERKQIGSN